MFYAKCLLTALVLYLFPEDLSAFLLPDRVLQKRDDSWLDMEVSPHLPELSDLGDLVYEDNAETTRDWGSRHTKPATFLVPLERLSVHHHDTPRVKPKDKRKRVSAPLDSLGSFMSSLRSRKENPDDYLEYTD